MKHLLKIPQKKTKCYVSYLDKPVKFELNGVKIKNIIGNNIECHIEINQSSIIQELDNLSYNTLNEKLTEWFEDDINIDNIYKYSYSTDISNINLILNNKTDCYINSINKDLEDIIELFKDIKRLKEYNINMEVSFLGLFIYNDIIINKWVIKSIFVEELIEDFMDWNKKEIEYDWENEIDNYELDIKNKIEEYNKSLIAARILFDEIKEETNFNIWDKKILKLKNIILKI